MFDLFDGLLEEGLRAFIAENIRFATDVMSIIMGSQGVISGLERLIGDDGLLSALANRNKASNSQLDTICQQTGACQ